MTTSDRRGSVAGPPSSAGWESVSCLLGNEASCIWPITTQLPVPSDAHTTKGLPGPEMSITIVQAGRIHREFDTRRVMPTSRVEASPWSFVTVISEAQQHLCRQVIAMHARLPAATIRGKPFRTIHGLVFRRLPVPPALLASASPISIQYPRRRICIARTTGMTKTAGPSNAFVRLSKLGMNSVCGRAVLGIQRRNANVRKVVRKVSHFAMRQQDFES